ncbi:MAG: transposase [Candidatus Nomurabacteria bacterium]|jgi:transposase|nr:transposase [Candidatus Nomurabacteria bacterium]
MATIYPLTFKQDVLAFYANNPNMPITQICKDFGISDATFYTWRKAHRLADGSTALPTNQGSPVSAEEHRRLQKRNLELEQENYVLKRAAAYFAKDALPKGNTLSF